MTDNKIRLSVSAVRAYHNCPAQYYYSRVLKLPAPTSPYAVFGTITHLSFYHAYAFPKRTEDGVVWEPTGEFSPKLALEVFDLLTGRDSDHTPLDDHQELLFSMVEPLDTLTFPKGRTKAMEGREGWTAHYRTMLEKAFEKPLDARRVLAVEKRVEYRMGGVDFLGYVDMLYTSDKGLTIIDLKTEYNKPSKQLYFNDQVARYYWAIPEAKTFWYYHLRSGTVFEVPRNDALIEALHNLDAQVADILSREDLPNHIRFPKRFGEHCIYCPYRKECWNGAIEDSTHLNDGLS